MHNRKYYYVIFGSGWDLYKQSYSDINQLDDAIYISDEIIRSNFLRRLHLGKINNYVNLPFKGIWNSLYFRNPFSGDRKICYIFFRNWLELDKDVGLIDYLKRKTLNAKFVFFLQDLYRNYSYPKDKFDLVLSFDHGDCYNYGFTYHPLVFSQYKGEMTDMPYSDIFFLGRVKDRLHDILSVYEVLKSENLKTDFNLVGVSPKDRVYQNEIRYIDNMTYKENLQHLLHTKCVLEIMQKGGLGYTQRVVEVVGTNKKLLTNNSMIKEAPFYNPAYISQFENAKDIDIDFLRGLSSSEEVDYNYREKLSPIELLNFIDTLL